MVYASRDAIEEYVQKNGRRLCQFKTEDELWWRMKDGMSNELSSKLSKAS